MSSSNLVRLGGMAALAAGALLLIGDLWTLVQALRYGDTLRFSEEASSTSYMVVSVAYLVGVLILLIAAAGLYARHEGASGTFGLIGFLAALVGTGLIVGLMWALTFIAPSAAIEAPAFLDAEENAGPLNAGFVISGVGFALSWALFGLAMLRARVLPRAATVALVVGALLTVAPLPASALVLDAALIWIGLIVLRERTSEASASRGGRGFRQPQTH